MHQPRTYVGEARFRAFSCIVRGIVRRAPLRSMMKNMPSTARHFVFPLRAFFGALLIATATIGVCAARDHVDGFDEVRSPAWIALYDKAATRITGHVRSTDIRHNGNAAELVEAEVASADTMLHLAYHLPPARLIGETSLSVWFFSTQDGAVLTARVVLPNQIDPDTGTNLTVLIEGDSYSKVGQWQKLQCKDIERKFRQMLPQIRHRMQSAGGKTDLDVSGRYVDTVVVKIRTSRGARRFVADELQFGPIVEVKSENRIRHVERTETEPEPEVKFHLGRLTVRGQPYFMRGIPYHGEQPADLARMRLNQVWIPNIEDAPLLSRLDSAGLRIMAVPPKADANPGGPQMANVSMHLAPFGSETSRISFWYLGTQIKPGARREIAAWQEQIRAADRTYQRPLMGDVSGSERAYSRHLSMLGVHRPAVQTSFSPKNYRDWLIEHRNLAMPGTFLWTWIQTEAPPSVNELREAAGWHPQVVEPDQLRLQVYAALAAGCRGIAFWTHSSLDDEHPGSAERKSMMALLNMELELLEPMLATGSPLGQATISVTSHTRKTTGIASPTNAGKSFRVREQEFGDRENQRRLSEQLARDLEAAMIHTDDSGLLVLPVWYADEAQYVPGPMAANDAKIVVPGVGESARAYEITTTEVRELQAERVTGGTQVVLKKLDMTAMILFTENRRLVEGIREKVKKLRESAARRITIEL